MSNNLKLGFDKMPPVLQEQVIIYQSVAFTHSFAVKSEKPDKDIAALARVLQRLDEELQKTLVAFRKTLKQNYEEVPRMVISRRDKPIKIASPADIKLPKGRR